jgi:hypothetical protein
VDRVDFASEALAAMQRLHLLGGGEVLGGFARASGRTLETSVVASVEELRARLRDGRADVGRGVSSRQPRLTPAPTSRTRCSRPASWW